MIIAPDPFFVPTEAFVAWMAARYKDKVILDVGCGYGNLVHALLRAGAHGTMGIDLMPAKIADALHRVAPGDLVDDLDNDVPLLASRLMVGDSGAAKVTDLAQVLIFARPCHDAAWIRATVERATAEGRAETFLYVSKPGNADADLAGFERKRHLVGVSVGQDEEEVWEFRVCPNAEDFDDEALARWCLVDLRGEIFWLRDGGGKKWHWSWGPAYFPQDGEPILEDAYIVDDINWLDHTKTTKWRYWDERVKDKTLDNGYVDPDGKLYRCAYWEHDDLVDHYLLTTTREIEDAGWLKIQRRTPDDNTLFIFTHRTPHGRPHRATKEQVQTLLDNGFWPPMYFLEEAEGDWDHVKRDDVTEEYIAPPTEG